MKLNIIIIISILLSLLSCDNKKNLNTNFENNGEIKFKSEIELKEKFISYLQNINSNCSTIKSNKSESKSFFNPTLEDEEINNLADYKIIKSYTIKFDINKLNNNDFKAKNYISKSDNNILLVPDNNKDFCIALKYSKKWTYMKLPSEVIINCIEKAKKVANNNEIFILRINKFSYYGFWNKKELRIYNPLRNKFLSDEEIFIMIQKYNCEKSNQQIIN